MLPKQKADEVVKSIASWIAQNMHKAVLMRANGSVLCETTNLALRTDDNNNPEVIHANGYSVCRIDAQFHLDQTPTDPIVVDVAQILDADNNPIFKTLHVGAYSSQDFVVVFEIAVPYIL